MARKNRRKFTLEFKLEAVRKVIVEDRTYKDVGKEINVSESVQIRWVREFSDEISLIQGANMPPPPHPPSPIPLIPPLSGPPTTTP